MTRKKRVPIDEAADNEFAAEIEEILGGIPSPEVTASPPEEPRAGTGASNPQTGPGTPDVVLPALPGFAMQDEPFEDFVPLGQAAMAAVEAVAKTVVSATGATASPAPASTLGAGAASSRRYAQRLQIVEEYQYPGHLNTAPPWINRNWTAYADFDDATKRPAGPALRIPGLGMVHRGDFVVRQKVLLSPEHSEERLAIYTSDEFYKLWMPVAAHA